MSCGEELKSYQTRRYLVLLEIVFGLASRYSRWGQSYWMGMGGYPPTHSNQTPNTNDIAAGVSPWVITSMVKRETTQTASQGPQSHLSSQGSQIPETTRMLAQKQPPFKECVIAHWSRSPAPRMIGDKHRAEAADTQVWQESVPVGVEACPKGPVERQEVNIRA
eukprot:TRINITY_DN3868_c0_g1_i1.p2 TRINITY_DN3868_c0_g1~~TRINITY_DN3868_c0_g1_i1.p2  ORF type:complete len:164 (-),score=9.73 TRINITY_DN3868_c0_g1_i1:78-569(-)